VALMLLSSMGMALAMAILRLGAERLERILRTLQGLCDACLRRPVIPMVLLVAVLSVAPLSGLHPLKGKSRAKRDPNIIIITVDTLRADHLGCYGYDLPTTPNIDRFAEEATLFTYCISAASHTVPAMVSMMTSQHPAYYGVNIADGIVMRLEEPTLARTLSENGYRAAAFVNNPLLDRNLRLYGGFDIYDDSLPDFEPMPGLLVEEYLKERKADDTGEYVDNWLTATAGERFFLWVHYMDPHGPYEPPERYLENFPESAYPGGPTKLSLADDKDRGGIPTYQYVKGRVSPQYYKSRYDGEIAFVDACVGRLLTRIKELDLWDNTIIVFTSDHGEALGEHDVYFHHSVDVTEEQLHVPLIVRIPGGEQVGKIDELVATIDIPTTILAAAGVNDNLGGSGRSLLPLIQGKTDGLDREYLVSEDIRDRISFHSRGMKYIADPDGDRLYDLDRDPDELNNMLGENPNLAAPWQSILNDYRSRPKKPGARIDPHDGGQLERLRALGYIN
jgi:arylsulfatase